MVNLILVRHGQTDWNIKRKFQGQTDIPLNTTGIKQAQNVATRLKNESFDKIISSDLVRAVKTAEIINDTHHVPHLQDRSIRERSFGEYEGRLYDRSDFPNDVIQAMDADPLHFCFPGGESLQMVANRADAFLELINATFPYQTLTVVSHGTFLSVLMCQIYNEPLTIRHKYRFENAEPLFIER